MYTIYIMEIEKKININLIEYINELGNSRLEFKISGKNIDYIIVNTLRRTILSDIPIYAFSEFKFNKNTSSFHNNYLKLRISMLPVWSIQNNIDENKEKIKSTDDNEKNILLETIDINNDINDDINDDNYEKYDNTTNNLNNMTSLKQITMYVNYKNKTNDIVAVTTSEAMFYYNEEQITSPYKIPILLLKLNKNQEISFSVISTLNTEKNNIIYSAVSAIAYKQINDEEFDFFLESRGQITEKEILLLAIINIKNKMNNLLKLINNNNELNNLNEGTFEILNEGHTLGNLISRGLQKHKNIGFAGYNLSHPLSNKLKFHFKLKKGNIKNIIEDVIDYYDNIFNTIKKLIETNL